MGRPHWRELGEEVEETPIIDPRNDPSEMGIITETAHRRPQALRSIAYRHSFAAM